MCLLVRLVVVLRFSIDYVRRRRVSVVPCVRVNCELLLLTGGGFVL
jgi:hypothetical protein